MKFPPAGVSRRADEVLGLIRAGVVNAASTGFEARTAEPIDTKRAGSGIRITSCELQEVSFVSISALPDALITERALDQVRKLARMPEGAGESETQAMSDPTNSEHDAQARAAIAELKRGVIARGLYDVAQLAWILEELGWAKDSAEWEASVENDASQVPAMLGAALKQLGEVLIAMTQEEVAELVGGGEAETAVVPEEEVIIEQSASPALKRFRLGLARAKRASLKPVKASGDPDDRRMRYHRRMAAIYERELAVHPR